MSLGSVFLQPQALQAAQRALDERPPNALLDLLTRLTTEVASGGPGLQIIQDEFVASLVDLLAEVEPRLGAARTRLEGIVQPLLDLASETLGGEVDGDGVDRAVATAQAFSEALATALGGLTSNRLGQVAGTVFDAVEIDLGLTESRARDILSSIQERIVNRLQADYIGGSADAAAYNRFALGAALREVTATLGDDLDLPQFTKATMLPTLVERLQATGMDGRIADAQGTTRKIGEAFTALKGVKDLLGGTAGVSLRADEADHCWYASWLKGERVAHPDCTNNPDLAGVDFGDTLTAQTMEDLARVSSVLTSLAEMAIHLGSMQKGDFVANLVNAVWHLVEAGLGVFDNYDPPKGVKWLIKIVGTALGGLERARLNDWFGPLMILSDLAEAQLYARWSWLTREALLSTFTLVNNTSGKVNHNYIEGVAHAFGELGSLLSALFVARTRKRDFGFPSSAGGSWSATIGLLLVGICVNIFMSLVVGSLVAFAFAGKGADAERIFRVLLKDRIFGRGTGGVVILQTLLTLLVHITDYYIYYFMFADGDTSGGKLTGVGKDTLEFPGYPNREDSPYRLPWAEGNLFQCAQGNHGLWSHTPFSFEIELYAFDFNFDNGDEILAIRDGVVWDYIDTHPNGNTERANKIIILHNEPESGHDFDEHGTPTRTFSVYLHGLQGSVVGAFPIPPTREKGGTGLGTPVSRGQVIMRADDTGRSAYNHLHLQIRPMNAAGELADYTIPFVFADEDLAKHDGVPRSNTWYDSSNVKLEEEA